MTEPARCPICRHTMALGELFDHIVTAHRREVEERWRREGY